MYRGEMQPNASLKAEERCCEGSVGLTAPWLRGRSGREVLRSEFLSENFAQFAVLPLTSQTSSQSQGV